jgi:hypothetical protein
MNQHTLTSVAEFLNSAGWNYSVFLRSYTTLLPVGASSEQLIRAAWGSAAVIDRIETVTPTEVVSEVRSSISYVGDGGAGPDPKSMQSERFAELLATLLEEIAVAARSAIRVEKFWISAGHPAYPVFWDFAFLFTGANEAMALVGSSSD